MSGTLYLCATPIGNLSDISLRALDVLRSVDLIAAEDTRITRKLLNHYEIHTPLTSYHSHNWRKKSKELLNLLQQGKNIALTTDAGFPAISDPGEEIVRQAIAEKVSLVVVPGPSACLTALVISGLPASRFVFEGFLPGKASTRKKRLQKLTGEERTMIFYEAPHRLLATLTELKDCFGSQRKIAVARELTKKFEEVKRGTIEEVIEYFTTNPVRGEFTLVVEGLASESINSDLYSSEDIYKKVKELEEKGLLKHEAIKKAANLLGLQKRVVYEVVLNMDNEVN